MILFLFLKQKYQQNLAHKEIYIKWNENVPDFLESTANFKKVKEIEKKLTNLTQNLISTKGVVRRFLMESDITIINDKDVFRERHFFLFNDLIIIAKTVKNSSNYKLYNWIPLRDCKIVDMGYLKEKHCFALLDVCIYCSFFCFFFIRNPIFTINNVTNTKSRSFKTNVC